MVLKNASALVCKVLFSFQPENQEVYAAWAHCMREFGHEQQTEALYKKLLTTKEPRLFYKLRFADFYYFSGKPQYNRYLRTSVFDHV